MTQEEWINLCELHNKDTDLGAVEMYVLDLATLYNISKEETLRLLDIALLAYVIGANAERAKLLKLHIIVEVLSLMLLSSEYGMDLDEINNYIEKLKKDLSELL